MTPDLPVHQKRMLWNARQEALKIARNEFAEGKTPALGIGQLLQSGIEQMTKSARQHWDCKRGCAMCCYEPVAISEPEAIYIARVLRDSMDAEQIENAIGELRTQVDRTAEIPDRVVWHKLRIACSFLSPEGACSIYEARPANCRAHNSLKVSDCEKSVEQPHISIPTDVGAHHAYGALLSGIHDAVFERGGKMRAMEFSSALLCALEETDAETRWIAGEDVFKNCAPAVRDWKPA